MTEASWAIAYHTNSSSPRSRKWYRVTRVIRADGKMWELHWGDSAFASNNYNETRERALNAGLQLLHGIYTAAPSPSKGSELIRVK